jgi:tetratricopeptide (TPR) repeat protein
MTSEVCKVMNATWVALRFSMSFVSVHSRTLGDNASIVADLQTSVAEQRTRLLRLRDSSYLRRFSETSSRQRSSLVVGMMHASLATKRRWNQELQFILERLDAPVAERRAEANKLLAEFRLAARTAAKEFIEDTLQFEDREPQDSQDQRDASSGHMAPAPSDGAIQPQHQQYLDDSIREVPDGRTPKTDELRPERSRASLVSTPVDSITRGYAAGSPEMWATPAEESVGLALRVSMCENATVAKRAAKETKLQMDLLGLLLDLFPNTPLPVTVYPSCTCTFAGHSVRVASIPPRTGDSLESSRCPELALALEYTGEVFNVTKYDCLTDDGREIECVGPPTATAFEGTDGRLYLETVLGYFPHFPPAKGQAITAAHTLFLRPEAVANAAAPVSPGAYVTFGGSSGPRHRENTTRCAQRLCGEVIPRVAKELVTNPPTDAAKMVQARLKPAGINVALLGVLLHHVPAASTTVRSIVFTEMIARAARAALEAAPGETGEAVIDAFKGLCAELCNPETQAAAFEELLPTLHARFPGSATLLASTLRLPNPLFDQTVFVHRLAKLHGVVLSRGVTGSGTSAFHFSVERLVVRASTLALGDHGVGWRSPPGLSLDGSGGDGGGIASPLSDSSSTGRSGGKGGINAGLETQLQRAVALAEPTAGLDEEAVHDLLKQLNELVHRRSLRSGKSSFAFRYDLYAAGLRLATIFPDRALHFLTQSLELGMPLGPETQGRPTVVRALCERANVLIAMRRFTEAERDLDDATSLLSEARPLLSPRTNSTYRFAAFDELTTRSSVLSPFQSVRISDKGQSKATSVRMFAVLAKMHESKRNFDLAESALRHVLHIQTSLLGEEHLAVATAWGSLGYNLIEQGPAKAAEAEEALRHDIRICRQLFGDLHPAMATSVGNLAFLLSREQRVEEAIELHRLDVEITAMSAPADSLDLATSRINLAVVLCRNGQLDEARELLVEGLRGRRLASGSNEAAIANALSNLANCDILLYRRDSDHAYLEAAGASAREAIEIIERIGGTAHPFLRVPLEHLGQVYALAGDGKRMAAVAARVEAVANGQAADQPLSETL